jgi:hypothetical protein
MYLDSCFVGGKLLSVGNKINSLVIKRIFRSHDNQGLLRVEASCICGKTIKTKAYYVATGRSKTCGCTRIQNAVRANIARATNIRCRKPHGWSSMVQLYNTYHYHARHRHLTFNLTKESFSVLTKQKCDYCGCEPKNVNKPKRHYGEYVYNGLDRLDNTKGYEPENVVPACGICNRAKGTMTRSEFINWILTVSKYQNEH